MSESQTPPGVTAGEPGDPPPRFLVDAMLGSLARWLRLLGYDAQYTPGANDSDLVRRARAEDRVILTRDHGLARRHGVSVLLIVGERLPEQIAQVAEAFPLPAAESGIRCALCNVALLPLAREAVARRVPAYVLASHHEFQECPACCRVYWRGSHWPSIDRQLREARDRQRPGPPDSAL